jgi:hypothetical protein
MTRGYDGLEFKSSTKFQERLGHPPGLGELTILGLVVLGDHDLPHVIVVARVEEHRKITILLEGLLEEGDQLRGLHGSFSVVYVNTYLYLESASLCSFEP